MREIKFRAWNTKKKRMYPPWSIWKTDLASYEEPYNLKLMEYTGLKDMNGKEIYEGDFVTVLNYLNGKIWEGHTHTDEVIFTQGKFDLKSPWCGESLSFNEVIVIGNKWEGCWS